MILVVDVVANIVVVEVIDSTVTVVDTYQLLHNELVVVGVVNPDDLYTVVSFRIVGFVVVAVVVMEPSPDRWCCFHLIPVGRGLLPYFHPNANWAPYTGDPLQKVSIAEQNFEL